MAKRNRRRRTKRAAPVYDHATDVAVGVALLCLVESLRRAQVPPEAPARPSVQMDPGDAIETTGTEVTSARFVKAAGAILAEEGATMAEADDA